MTASVPVGQALEQAQQIKSLTAEMEILRIAHARADGALADAVTVPTGDLERGILALTEQRNEWHRRWVTADAGRTEMHRRCLGAEGDVKALAEALERVDYLVDGYDDNLAVALRNVVSAALARDGVRRGRGKETG